MKQKYLINRMFITINERNEKKNNNNNPKEGQIVKLFI